MSKYCGPRLRVVRRLGELPALTRKSPKLNTRPGQGGRNKTKITQFSYRLAEKQKLRFYYGISEKQLILYVKKRRKIKGSTEQILLQQIEQRLDNIIYQLNWAPTLPFARQLVNHGHILVNEKRINIPSFSCPLQSIIKVKNAKNSYNLIQQNLESIQKPSYLSTNTESLTAIFNRKIDRQELQLNLNELLVIEYYSNRLLR
jgi:small subunit ribosomal protein S4